MTRAGRVLVTGATGCLGRHLVERLAGSGATIRTLVRASSRVEPLEELGCEIQRGSLEADEDLKRAVRDVRVIFHLGGLVIDNRPWDTSDVLWQQIRRTNVEGPQRLARMAAAAGVERLVFCSSVRLFGFGSQMLWQEDDPRSPSDLYSRGKAEAEEALLRFSRETGLEVVNVRPRFIYGNHDRYVLPGLVQIIQRGKSPMLNGGEAICDITYVKDCVQALMLAAERPVAGQSYNITSGECLSVRDILLEVARAMGRSIRFTPVPTALAFGAAAAVELGSRLVGRDPSVSRAQLRWYLNDHHFSISKARRELGYQPQYRLPDALKEIDLQQFLA
jgi:nucleoside-diphosphate-sugar epimerase